MTRRTFLKTTAIALTSAPVLQSAAAEDLARGQRWPIGCLNRPWAGDKRNWGYDVALDGIKAAGYKLTGLLTRTPKEPFTGADASPEYLAELKKRIAARGLIVNMSALRTKDDLPLEKQIQDMRTQMDHAKFMGVQFLLTFGVTKAEHYANYYKLMSDAAGYADERGLKLVLKPHGGASGAAEEIIRCLQQVKHANFKVWFDPGNIIFYTGKDPVEELKPIVQHVTGICAKDCEGQKGSVWLEFGKGKVDFPGVFKELKKAGFNGPVMVECCELGETPEAVTDNARKNRLYLEQLSRTV